MNAITRNHDGRIPIILQFEFRKKRTTPKTSQLSIRTRQTNENMCKLQYKCKCDRCSMSESSLQKKNETSRSRLFSQQIRTISCDAFHIACACVWPCAESRANEQTNCQNLRIFTLAMCESDAQAICMPVYNDDAIVLTKTKVTLAGTRRHRRLVRLFIGVVCVLIESLTIRPAHVIDV